MIFMGPFQLEIFSDPIFNIFINSLDDGLNVSQQVDW